MLSNQAGYAPPFPADKSAAFARTFLPYKLKQEKETLGFLHGLQFFLDAQSYDIDVNTDHGLAVQALYAQLRGDTPVPSNFYQSSALPRSAAADRLVTSIMRARGYRTPDTVGPRRTDPAFQYRTVGQILIALLAATHFATEANFGAFDFLIAVRSATSTTLLKHFFARWVSESIGAPPDNAINWAASIMLSLLHPALARKDTPPDLVFGSLEWADLTAAIALLAAAGCDHGDFSHAELMDLARDSWTAAKLNEDVAGVLWQIQAPAALWLAHAAGEIDLASNSIDADMIHKAITSFDRKRSAALYEPLDSLAPYLTQLRQNPASREALAQKVLTELDLNLATRHQMEADWKYKRICRGKHSLLSAYLKGCQEFVNNGYCIQKKRCHMDHVPPLNEVVAKEDIRIFTLQAAAFEEVVALAGRLKLDIQFRDRPLASLVDEPTQFPEAAEQFKRTLIPFSGCVTVAGPVTPEAHLKSCGINLDRIETDAMKTLHTERERLDKLLVLITKKLNKDVAIVASRRFADDLRELGHSGSSASLPSTLKARQLAADSVLDRHSQQHLLPTNDIRLIASPLTVRRFFGSLAGMLESGLSTPRIKGSIRQAAMQRTVLASTFAARMMRDNSTEIIWRFALPPDTEIRPIKSVNDEFHGEQAFALNGQFYETRLFAAQPTLRSMEAMLRLSQNTALCREERALSRQASGGKACETTSAIVDENQMDGHLIEHRGEFIAIAPVEGTRQRPRYAQTIFFHENPESRSGQVAIIDQVLFRQNSREQDHYRRIPSGEQAQKNLIVRALPDSMSGRLIRSGPAERPTVEYHLEGWFAGTHPDNGTQLRTRLRKDFHVRPATAQPASGMVEVAENEYFMFALESGVSELTLRRNTDQATILAHVDQPTTRQDVLSTGFSVRVSATQASTMIDIVCACGVAENIERALRSAMRNAATDPQLIPAMMAYIGNRSGEPENVVPDIVLQGFNAAMTEIMKSVDATHDFRASLIQNYRRMRPDVAFNQIHVPPYPSRALTNSVAARALEANLRHELDLCADIFTDLNFNAVLTRSSDLRSESAQTQGSREQLISTEFGRIFGERNFAIVSATLSNGSIIHYYSVSGGHAAPQHRLNDHQYILVEGIPDQEARFALPSLPNMSPSFRAQNRDGDTERVLLNRLLLDFPRAGSLKKITLLSRKEICHSCTLCCIAYSRRWPTTPMNFNNFPASSKADHPSSQNKQREL